MMIFQPTRSLECRRAEGSVATAVQGCRLPRGIGEKNEKRPATFSGVGYLNSRSANFISGLIRPSFSGLQGRGLSH
jgi:hypothetical protein